METRTGAVTESQMRQALDMVLRELAHALLQALPEYPKRSLSTFQSDTDSIEPLPNSRLLVTIAEAATLLSVSRTVLYRMMSEGQIRTIQIGRLRRVPVSALHDFIAAQLREPN